jgi:hypothetical protein
MAQLLISTTGTLNPVTIKDLGAVDFNHPLVDFVIYDTDSQSNEFYVQELYRSEDLQYALNVNHLTLKDDLGTNYTSLVDAIQYLTDSEVTITTTQIDNFSTAVSNNTDVAANTAARHDALTLGGAPGDTTDDTLNLAGQELTVNTVTTSTDGAMSSTDKTKLDGIATNANNYTHPNHTGEVTSTGDGAQVLDKTAITNKTEVTPEAGDFVLITDASDSNNLKKANLGTLPSSGLFDGAITINSFITTATFTGNADDWNPTNLATANAIRMSSTHNVDLTGIAAQEDGRFIIMYNVGLHKIKFKKNSPNSLANNRFLANTDYELFPNESILVHYDGTDNRWRIPAKGV